jgi:transposase
MYIRQVIQKNAKTGECYSTYRLVESYRNAEGKARQRALLNLGKQFPIEKKYWKLLADRVDEIRRRQEIIFDLEPVLEQEAQRIAKILTQKYSEIVPVKSDGSSKKTDYQTVDVNSLTHEHVRKVGNEHVAFHAAKQLTLEAILAECGFNQKQISVALASIIGRLVHPGSERATHRYLREHSALDELLGVDFSSLPLKNLYQISDKLWKHKALIEQRLYRREKELFQLEDVITLFDLTNTYFEGRCASNPKARHGRSKEKRSDCPLVTLGMVLDASGFPKKSQIFEGNVSEPQTLQQMLEALDGDKKVRIVMDAGIATEANIAWLKAGNYRYIVVSRKRKLVMPTGEKTLIVKEEKNNCVTASLIKNEETEESELYCHSQAKEAKSREMVSKAGSRFEIELEKLATGLKKKSGAKMYDKILQRVGRLKEKNKRVAHLYDIFITPDEKNKYVLNISWAKKEESFEQKQRGIYCLRTNDTTLDAQTFWDIYTMLTELEAAFRSLKSELGLRPVYHQKEHRIDGHLFISLLAYHLLHTLRYQLKIQGIHDSWSTLREGLDTQCRLTTRFTLQKGRTVQIRKSTSPDAYQSLIYKTLGIASHPGGTEKVYF